MVIAYTYIYVLYHIILGITFYVFYFLFLSFIFNIFSRCYMTMTTLFARCLFKFMYNIGLPECISLLEVQYYYYLVGYKQLEKNSTLKI